MRSVDHGAAAPLIRVYACTHTHKFFSHFLEPVKIFSLKSQITARHCSSTSDLIWLSAVIVARKSTNEIAQKKRNSHRALVKLLFFSFFVETDNNRLLATRCCKWLNQETFAHRIKFFFVVKSEEKKPRRGKIKKCWKFHVIAGKRKALKKVNYIIKTFGTNTKLVWFPKKKQNWPHRHTS